MEFDNNGYVMYLPVIDVRDIICEKESTHRNIYTQAVESFYQNVSFPEDLVV